MATPIVERTRADSQWSPERYRLLCRVKRFFERYDGDSAYRETYAENPRAALATVAPELDIEDVEALRRVPRDPSDRIVDDESLPPLARDYCRFVLERALRFNRLREEAEPVEPRLRAWRRRRMAEAANELGLNFARTLMFSTAAFELSKGCSVGCWFCGVAAPKLEGHLRYTPQNRLLWREVLESMVELCGREAMRINFCFWATDPLDNPDYEAFAEDYREIGGAYPPLTTALPLRDADRTRRMLNHFDADVCRFSITTLGMLERLHEEFTPEELGGVNLALVNKESKAIKANVGSFRDRAREQPRLLDRERGKRDMELRFFPREAEGADEDVPSTISCVAGFLVNMVERRVRLVSPCAASDRWPLGFVVYAERGFRDGRDFRIQLRALIDEHMFLEWPEERPVGFRPQIDYRAVDGGFELRSRYRRFQTRAKGREAYCHDLGEYLARGQHHPGEIADTLLRRHFVGGDETDRLLANLLSQGVLDEEPAAASTSNEGDRP